VNMMPAPRQSAKPRRSQAERRAATRAALIEAAIACIHERGYHETSTQMVAKVAGVTRGAVTHYFPTRTDLMEAIVTDVYARDIDRYLDLFAQAGSEGFFNLPEMGWKVVGTPSGIAVTEILLATRSDPELAIHLRDLQLEIEKNARARLADWLRRAGYEPGPKFNALHRLLVAAVRGLAIDSLFTEADEEIAGSIELLKDLVRQMYPRKETVHDG
jgi:AcrR family transcriptional regulator